MFILHVVFVVLALGKSGVVFAVKLYPAGATTNSQDGVTDVFGKCLPVLEEMARQEMPLLVSSCLALLPTCIIGHFFQCFDPCAKSFSWFYFRC